MMALRYADSRKLYSPTRRAISSSPGGRPGAPARRDRIIHCGDIEVFTTNDWLIVELDSISTLTTTSVPAATRSDVGFSVRSEQQGLMPTVSTSRGGRTPVSVESASTL